MTRSILAGLAAAVAVALLSGTGCQSTGIGDPCTPEQEYDPSFLGFNIGEVSTESKSFQCQTRLCLVNHFQGRVSCPYGQDSDKMGNPQPKPMANACALPGIGGPVTGKDVNGNFKDNTAQAAVLPQCNDRNADKTVYCSCRCANVQGNTNDGAVYCKCPDGFTCTQLVSAIPLQDTGLAGAYCIKQGTQYDPNSGSCSNPCDSTAGNCGNVQGVGGS